MSLKRNVFYKVFFFIIKLASVCKFSNHLITYAGKIILPYCVCKYNFTSCARANNSHVELVKYLMNKNYSILILINIKN
jgi:hypothetical protein